MGLNSPNGFFSSHKVIQTVPEEESLKSLQNSMPSNGPRERVLGINWEVSSDQFFFKMYLPDALTTKRGILVVTNSLYDSLGFVSPVVLLARLIYSEICQDKLGWDEPIKEPYLKRWRAWIVGLVHLRHLKVPRCHKPKCDNKIQMQLHLFSNASNVARGIVCCLRVVFANSAAKCSLVMAKTRVSGAGRYTISQAELEQI